MHLVDGLIPVNQAIIYWILTIVIIALFSFKLSKTENKDKNLILIALFTVVTFIASSIQIPSFFGIPIHFFVIPLVVIILGPLTGTLVVFLSLLVQAFFGIGGFTVLGANTLVMGLALGVTTFVFFKLLKEINYEVAVFSSTVMGIIAATVTQVLILIFAGLTNFEIMLVTLVPFYMFIAIIEGIANVLIVTFLFKTKREILELKTI